MPHYWFRVPLSGTADHLKRAKQTGGAPKVKHELKKDARDRGKCRSTERASLQRTCRRSCDVDVCSADRMSAAECNWFHERWETGESGCPERGSTPTRPSWSPDSGWIRDPGTSD